MMRYDSRDMFGDPTFRSRNIQNTWYYSSSKIVFSEVSFLSHAVLCVIFTVFSVTDRRNNEWKSALLTIKNINS